MAGVQSRDPRVCAQYTSEVTCATCHVGIYVYYIKGKPGTYGTYGWKAVLVYTALLMSL
jgi:hypothetical protein